MLSKCSPAGSALTADRYNRYLTQQVAQRQENQWGAGLLGSQRCRRNENIVPLPHGKPDSKDSSASSTILMGLTFQ